MVNPKYIAYLVIAALVLGSLGFLYFYVREAEEAKIKLEVIEKEQTTEEKTRDATRNSPTDPDAVLDRLRGRD